MQRNAITDVRVVHINGENFGSLAAVPSTLAMMNQEGIEVAEPGFTGKIPTGQEIVEELEFHFWVKAGDKVITKALALKKAGGHVDIVIYCTDKSGNTENAYLRQPYEAELGKINIPDFEQGSRKAAKLTIIVYPYRPSEDTVYADA